MTEIEQLQEENERLKKENKLLDTRLSFYEMNGPSKLYYALTRKASEMADLLNKNSLKDIPLDDPKDKTFDRLKVIWNDSASLSSAIKELGITAGVTGDENKDLARKPFVDTIADSRH